MPYVYDEAAAVRYDAAVSLQPGEVDFYLELARDAQSQGLPTLELACGTGRIALPLAREGIAIVGVDNSPAMLERARAKSLGLENARWLEGDMRDFDLGERFGLIFIAVGTFQLLHEVEEQLACLRCIERHLAPTGRFAFEVENPDLVRMSQWLTDRRGTFVRNPSRDHDDPDTGRRVLAWDTVEYHPSRQRYTSQRIHEELDSDGRTVARRSYNEPMVLRYFHRYEMEHLLARAGLEVEALYGDTLKNEYRSTSPDFIWVARAM
ncbi:MAG: class I SAM-dependent methyltransferase [Dehalococcoidia bacterium]